MVHPRTSGFQRDFTQEQSRIRRIRELKRDAAVSPVVGIMLLITITLILAAIISGMAGGIAQTQSKPPSLLMEVSIVNGSYNSMDITILSVSEGIPTRDLKFIAEWRRGSTIMRNTITAGSPKIEDNSGIERRFPVGLTTNTTAVSRSDFGDYPLLPGTRMFANTSKSLESIFTTIPPAGSNVRIQLVHVPSGAIIAEKELTVEEG